MILHAMKIAAHSSGGRSNQQSTGGPGAGVLAAAVAVPLLVVLLSVVVIVTLVLVCQRHRRKWRFSGGVQPLHYLCWSCSVQVVWSLLWPLCYCVSQLWPALVKQLPLISHMHNSLFLISKSSLAPNSCVVEYPVKRQIIKQ